MSYKCSLFCLKFIIWGALMLLLQHAVAQDFTSLNATIEQRKSQFGGKVAVMVWKDTLLYQKATGDLTVNTQGPVGCASAWFTAALAMYYVEQGKISLDDPVSKFLPIFATYAKSYLTIRHCLANTSGIEPDKGGVQKYFQKTKFATLDDEVNSFAKREIKNNPGEVFFFNNIGSDIVGRILEIVGKKSFDRLVLEKIFRPSGMKRSTFANENAVNPFSGAVSTPADMLKFLSMLLSKGTIGAKKILSPASIEEMQKMQTGEAKIIFAPKQAEGYAYGIGNWIGSGDNERNFMSPSLSGGWQFIDVKNKYACVIFGDAKDKEDKKEVYLEIAEAVKQQVR